MLRPIIFTFLVRIVSAVLNFLVIVVLSQELGTEGKGICAKYIAIIANALIFCDFLGGPPLVYLLARHRITNILVPTYLWSAVTSVVVMYFFMLAGQIDSNEFIYLSVLSFLNSCIAIHQNILAGKMQFFKLNVILLLQTVLLFFSLRYFISLTGPHTIDYIWALAIAWGLSALIGFLFIINLDNSGGKISLRKFLGSAFGFGFINISGHTLQYLNQRLSFFLMNNRLLGVFSNAVQIGESVWIISNSIASVQYGKISNTEKKDYAERISLVLLKINLVFCMLAAVIMALLPDSFFTWLFGDDFNGIHHVLLYLAPGLVLYSGYLILGHHFSGTGNFIKNLYCIITGLAFTALGLSVIYFVYDEFTMHHLAMVTSLSYLGNFICALLIFRRDADLSLSDFLPGASDLDFIRRELKRKGKEIPGQNS